ncbi:hypothetical protein [Nocardia sp. NPDC057668]|uniref:hypothetical protein n=1 Tax=Nocardia sp. NPDC057668 TaxID=3346202 RepID=UPI003670F8DA
MCTNPVRRALFDVRAATPEMFRGQTVAGLREIFLLMRAGCGEQVDGSEIRCGGAVLSDAELAVTAAAYYRARSCAPGEDRHGGFDHDRRGDIGYITGYLERLNAGREVTPRASPGRSRSASAGGSSSAP